MARAPWSPRRLAELGAPDPEPAPPLHGGRYGPQIRAWLDDPEARYAPPGVYEEPLGLRERALEREAAEAAARERRDNQRSKDAPWARR